MNDIPDAGLLEQFTWNESEAAFAELVRQCNALKRGCMNCFRCGQQVGNKRSCVTFRQAFTRFAASWAVATCLKMATRA